MIKVGLVGYGVIGEALGKWISENNSAIQMLISDPFKGYNDDVAKADVIFISVHIPTENDGTQDLKLLKEILNNLPQQTPIFVRTTILPGTTDLLRRETQRNVHFMPEFLTERTAYADFCEQPMVFTAETALLRQIFVGKKYIEMTSLEAEIAKYAHNVFGALKVTYFNGIYALCQKMGADYPKVQEGVLLSGYINAAHTMVPGPDGKRGFGGKCFPKDASAFDHFNQNTALGALLHVMMKSNEEYRN